MYFHFRVKKAHFWILISNYINLNTCIDYIFKKEWIINWTYSKETKLILRFKLCSHITQHIFENSISKHKRSKYVKYRVNISISWNLILWFHAELFYPTKSVASLPILFICREKFLHTYAYLCGFIATFSKKLNRSKIKVSTM